MTEKIKNLGIKTTKQQEDAEWAEVLAYRNKLLSSSDWTQLKDVSLTKIQSNFWRDWRKKLRKINKSVCNTPKAAKDLIDLIERDRPKRADYDDQLDDRVEITDTKLKTTERIFVKEQPVIIKEELSKENLEKLFIDIFSENPLKLKDFLNTIITDNYDNVFSEHDSLEIAKNKIKKYLKIKSNELLNNKINNLTNYYLLQQKTEEALEYLSIHAPLLENFPLIKLNSMVMKKSPKEIANEFLEEKRIFNQILLDSERFTLYNMNRIDLIDSLDQLYNLFTEIKNGY